jgi:hypothetical protein
VLLDFTPLAVFKARKMQIHVLQVLASNKKVPKSMRVAAADELGSYYARGLESRIILIPRFAADKLDVITPGGLPDVERLPDSVARLVMT